MLRPPAYRWADAAAHESRERVPPTEDPNPNPAAEIPERAATALDSLPFGPRRNGTV